MKAASVPESTGFDPAGLIENHQAGVWRYLRVLGCDAVTADDITQETFLAVLQRPFQDYNSAATAAYLRRTAYHFYVSARRRAGKCQLIADVDRLDETWSRWAGQDGGEALLDALRECLGSLTNRARMALEMRFRDRQSRAKIAAQLEITEHGAKNLMQRAKQKLRDCVKGKLE